MKEKRNDYQSTFVGIPYKDWHLGAAAITVLLATGLRTNASTKLMLFILHPLQQVNQPGVR